LIYSAKHRPSLGERAVNLIGPTITLVLTWWLVFSGLLAGPPDASPFLLALGFVVSLAVGVFIHETGHLLVGLALGLAVRKIRIGSGPTLVTFRPRGIRVQVGINPFGGGAVYPSGLDHSSRDVKIVTSAAGPVTNLLAALYGLGMVHFGIDWLGVFALVNLLLGVTNLIPHKFTLDGHEQPNDGMQILQNVMGTAKKGLYYEGAEVASDAQIVQVRAIEEARDAGSAEINDMHLLLGLAGDRDVRPLLAPLDLRALLRTAGPSTTAEVKPTWAPVTDRVEQAAARAARDLGLTKADAACICLGLMAVDCPAGRLLKESGVSEAALRALATSRYEPSLARDGAPGLADLPVERWGSAAERTIALAAKIAKADRSTYVGTEHILAALTSEPASRAARALDRLGLILVRDGGAALKREVPAAAPVVSPQAAAAMAAALGRTGPTYPTGTGELCLGIADQATGMGAMLLAGGGVRIADLERALPQVPRDPSEPLGCTPASRWRWELRARARLGAGRFLDARADFMVLEQHAPSDAVRALDRNNIAWASLMSGDPALRGEALELSRLAVEFKADQASFKGTYAFALMENGSVAEAAALLQPIASMHPRPRDRALDLCLLAICHARLHDAETAAKDLQAAEAADPRCQLLERARAEMAPTVAVAIP
jgi:Zn-dependent protease